MPLTLALVPLDERPVNTRLPQMLGAIGGAEVLLPPAEMRGHKRTPADLPALDAWLWETAHHAQTALVSCDYFAYGNLINARISHTSAAYALSRLAGLAELNIHCPVHAFSLVTRVSNADDAVEEPEYWAQWGTKCYAYARLTHQQECGALDPAGQLELAALQSILPPNVLADWLGRRLRNHTVNLGLLDMATRGNLTSLLLTSDDTSPWGFPSRERNWLATWADLVGPALSNRVRMYPGADEVGSALVAARLNAQDDTAPTVWPCYAIDGDAALVAPYEDRPVRETVQGQIAACGCVLAPSPEGADIILGVVTPSPRRTDYRPEFLDEDRLLRTEAYTRFLQTLGAWQTQGRPVAFADVAYPNGADPLLMEMLLAHGCPLDLGKLAAFGAWNTAGNTLGVVVAQASCARRIGGDPGRARAQGVFLAHRFLEDWDYQAVARRLARDDAEQRWARREPDPDSPAEQAVTCAVITGHLADLLTRLQGHGVGVGLHLAPGSVALPWQRTFEVDFVLE